MAFVRQVPVTVTTAALACEQAFGRAGNWGKEKPPFPSPFLVIFSLNQRACSLAYVAGAWK